MDEPCTMDQVLYITALEDSQEFQEAARLFLRAHLKDENKGINALTKQEASDLIGVLLGMRNHREI